MDRPDPDRAGNAVGPAHLSHGSVPAVRCVCDLWSCVERVSTDRLVGVCGARDTQRSCEHVLMVGDRSVRSRRRCVLRRVGDRRRVLHGLAVPHGQLRSRHSRLHSVQYLAWRRRDDLRMVFRAVLSE